MEKQANGFTNEQKIIVSGKTSKWIHKWAKDNCEWNALHIVKVIHLHLWMITSILSIWFSLLAAFLSYCTSNKQNQDQTTRNEKKCK